MSVKAIIFDLYGTLVAIQERRFMKQFYKRHLMQLQEGKQASTVKRLVAHIRDDLMTIDLSTQPFPKDFIAAFSSITSTNDETVEQIETEFREALIAEADSTKLLPGAKEILLFFKRRGYLIGIVSNISTYHKKPFFDFGLDKIVDAATFSCDVGVAKPQPKIYLEACKRLNVNLDEAIIIGDSYKIDIKTPISLGMKAIHISKTSTHNNVIDSISDMGLMIFSNGSIYNARSMLNDAIEIDGDRLILDMTLLQNLCGKYNILYKCSTAQEQDKKDFFLKRHLNPSAAFVDQIAQHIAHLTGLQNRRPVIVEIGNEPLLLSPAIFGIPFNKHSKLNSSLLHQVGQHAAFAYIFANVDFHPRNAFVQSEGDHTYLRMIDYEHCFFDMEYDLRGVSNAFDPYVIEEHIGSGVGTKIVRETMTPRAIRRFMYNFANIPTMSKDDFNVICSGITDYFDKVMNHKDKILDMLYERQKRQPYLIIGTFRHQRALISADIDRINTRISNSSVNYLIDTISPQ